MGIFFSPKSFSRPLSRITLISRKKIAKIATDIWRFWKFLKRNFSATNGFLFIPFKIRISEKIFYCILAPFVFHQLPDITINVFFCLKSPFLRFPLFIIKISRFSKEVSVFWSAVCQFGFVLGGQTCSNLRPSWGTGLNLDNRASVRLHITNPALMIHFVN